jgi:hypothetical protein
VKYLLDFTGQANGHALFLELILDARLIFDTRFLMLDAQYIIAFHWLT